MDMLKKYFPFSAKVKEKDVTALVVSIIIYVVASAVVGLVLGFVGSALSFIPLVKWLFDTIGWLFGLYCTVGIVISVLNFFNILK